jgi:hypothetical protein
MYLRKQMEKFTAGQQHGWNGRGGIVFVLKRTVQWYGKAGKKLILCTSNRNTLHAE